jgi:hypothetical protein
MKQMILNLMALLTLSVMPMTTVAAAPSSTDCPDATSSKGRVLEGAGKSGNQCDDGAVVRTINRAVEILSIIVGIAAIIMVVISGFKYITSGGESSKVSSAKTTLIYALVGVAIAALAQILVRFVLTESSKAA